MGKNGGVELLAAAATAVEQGLAAHMLEERNRLLAEQGLEIPGRLKKKSDETVWYGRGFFAGPRTCATRIGECP